MARRSFGTVRKLPSGKWHARYRNASGRQVGAGTFTTKAEANRALSRIQVAMERGQLLDPKAGRISFADYSKCEPSPRKFLIATGQ